MENSTTPDAGKSSTKWLSLLRIRTAALIAVVGSLVWIGAELQIIRREAAVAGRLWEQEHYYATYEDGWLHRLLPETWPPRGPVIGDRVVGVVRWFPDSQAPKFSEILDDLKELHSLQHVTLEIVPAGAPTGIIDEAEIAKIAQNLDQLATDDEFPTLREIDSLTSVYILNQQKGVYTKNVIRSMRSLKIRHFAYFSSVVEDEDLTELARVPSLKVLEFKFCKTVSKTGLDQFKKVRPEIKVLGP